MKRAAPKTELPPSTQLRKAVFGGAHVPLSISLKNPPVLENTSGPVKTAQKISLYNRVQAILIFGEGVLMVFFTVHF